MRVTQVRSHAFAWAMDGRGAARGTRARESIVIEVRGDGGEIGLGEAAPLPGMSRDTLGDAAAAIARLEARVPFVLEIRPGGSPAWISVVELARDVAPASAAARFAIETALLDMLTRAAHAPLADWFASTPATRAAIAAVVDDANDARIAYAAGVRTLKIKLGPDEALGRVRAIADAAPGAKLRIDANQSWPIEIVPTRLAALVDLVADAIAYVEEPCRDTRRLLREPLPCKLALDESLQGLSHAEIIEQLAQPQLAAIVLKPSLLGLYDALVIAQATRYYGPEPVVSHALEGPIGSAACAQLALAVDLGIGCCVAGLAAHAGLGGWRLAVPQIAADHIHAVDAPGLGFAPDLDLDAVIAAAPEAP
ncbi:MAG TPA: enolase C-terminal domain-like protein [Kofleriaceae bacterium]|nr:enolase C-terminal domain-like protein [Kofleriaceae bacterium]